MCLKESCVEVMQLVESLRRIACRVCPRGVLLLLRKLWLRPASFASRGNLFLNLRGTLCASLWYWCGHFDHIVWPFCPHGLAILTRWGFRVRRLSHPASRLPCQTSER